jgi:hypothetical protein
MNEKLKQLAKEAGFMPDNFISRWEDEFERLSKLIVLECIQNIRDNMEVAKVDTLGDKDLFLETLRTSGHFYITELEQHFGVAK